MTTLLPYEWLKEVPTALLQSDNIPLLGFPPTFPWKEFSEKLKSNLELKDVEIKPLELSFKTSQDLFSALGQDLVPIHIQIPSLDGDLTLVFAKRDVEQIMSLLLSKNKQPLDVIDPEFQKGFVHFLAYEAIYIFNECHFDKSLNPHIGEKDQESDEEIKEMLLQREKSLCQDISLSIDGSTFILRLIISDEFRQAWKEKYAARSLDIPLNSELAKKIHIPVALEVGRVSLKYSEWKEIHPGDFLILDLCSLDPSSDRGKVMMTVNGNHFFRAKLKQGTLKILEHPLFYEGQFTEKTKISETLEKNKGKTTMAKEHFEDEDVDFDEDFTFDDSESESVQESFVQQESVVESEESEAQTDRENSLTEDEKTTHEELSHGPKFSAEEMVLDIVVEVGRLEMSIQKLTELQPGNILEIDVRPENGVDLVVNGKRIGKAELLKVGEVLGVRILDI